MSPGPLSSASRGGLSFTHGGGRNFGFAHRQASFYGTRQVAPPVNRIYGADRQRFAVTPGADGGTTITFDETETATVGTVEDGGVSITVGVKPEAEPEIGEGEDTGGNSVDVEFEVVERRRRLSAALTRAAVPGVRERLHVSGNPDGSVTIDVTDPAHQLVVLGDPESNVLTVGEVPMPAD